MACNKGLRTENGLLGASLGLLSVGLGFVAVGMAAKSDKRYTDLLNRVDRNVVQILSSYERYEAALDTIEERFGGATVKVEPAAPATDLRGEVTVENKTKAAAQKRLDEDEILIFEDRKSLPLLLLGNRRWLV